MDLSKLLICLLLVGASYANPTINRAPVSGFAQSFIYNTPIANGIVTVLETGQQIKTDKEGRFGPFLYPVGKSITLVFEKFGYKTTQSATVKVPPQGLTGPYDNITFQVPSLFVFYAMKMLIGAKAHDNSCHVATTVTAFHKTLEDLPQGEVNAEVSLNPATTEPPFYFGIFTKGPLINKTSPFSKDLKKTSQDGGVLFFNLPPRKKPYLLSAKKAGRSFSETQFLCRRGVFINLSPPHGPMVKN